MFLCVLCVLCVKRFSEINTENTKGGHRSREEYVYEF